MKKLLLVTIGVSIAAMAYALDNTIINDFWNTTGYVNPQPARTEIVTTFAVATPVDMPYFSNPVVFDSYAPGFLLFFR